MLQHERVNLIIKTASSTSEDDRDHEPNVIKKYELHAYQPPDIPNATQAPATPRMHSRSDRGRSRAHGRVTNQVVRKKRKQTGSRLLYPFDTNTTQHVHLQLSVLVRDHTKPNRFIVLSGSKPITSILDEVR